MYLISIKNVVNLPFMIIHRMGNTAKHSKTALPYSIAFTKVFRYFEVDLIDELIETP